MSFLLGIKAKLIAAALVVVGVMSAIGIAYAKGVTKTKTAIKAKSTEKALKRAVRAAEIEDEVEALKPDAVDEQLADNGWMRSDSDKG